MVYSSGDVAISSEWVPAVAKQRDERIGRKVLRDSTNLPSWARQSQLVTWRKSKSNEHSIIQNKLFTTLAQHISITCLCKHSFAFNANVLRLRQEAGSSRRDDVYHSMYMLKYTMCIASHMICIIICLR